MRTFLLGAALMLCACKPEPEHRADTTIATRPSPTIAAQFPDSASAPALPSMEAAANHPAAAFARYLAYATFRGAPAGGDGLSECPPFDESGDGDVQEGWEPDDYVGFVLPRVLATSMDASDSTGKTASGRAEVVRVAEIGRDSVGWVGTLGRRVDTLSFTIQRGPTGWTVCGPATSVPHDSLPGAGAFVVTYEDALRTEVNEARWLPPGTTWQSVASHADSVLKARR